MQNNDKILTENEPKNSKARIKANGKYLKNNYKRINIAVRPEQAEAIRETAKQFDISIAQLIINSVNEYKTNHGADPAQPEKPEAEQPEKPEIVTAESSMKSGETAGAQPEQYTEEETENEIETEEENQTAGAEEEPQEDEDEKPEDIPAFVWEQIQRLKKADKKHTEERKAREAAERKRRRLGEIEN